MKKKNKISKIRWEIARLLSPHSGIGIKPTTRCNQRCDYCLVNIAHNGRPPVFDEKPWYYLFGDIMKEGPFNNITITGGEPALYDGISYLINNLVEQKNIILIFTNLSKIEEFMKIRKTWRVIFYSTYHEPASLKKYMQNYEILSRKFYITVREIRHRDDLRPKLIPFSKITIMLNKQNTKKQRFLAPDGRIFWSCRALDEGGK